MAYAVYKPVYYRVYDDLGEAPSKSSFDPSEPCLGRIDTLSVPPPHTVASLKRCLNQVEEYTNRELQLFEDDDGETIMGDNDAIAFHTDTYFPGTSEDNPMALVTKVSFPKALKGIRAAGK
jgi:hypothetical protein